MRKLPYWAPILTTRLHDGWEGMSEPSEGSDEALGIPPFLARWTEEELFWLGRDTDWAIAKALGRSEKAIAAQRSLRGIPAYREPGD